MYSWLKQVLFSFMFVSLSASCYAGSFYAGYNAECYVDTEGNDWYWFCGKQSESCHDNAAARRNVRNWYKHGQSFDWTKRGGLGTYWCCNGTLGSDGVAGIFYAGSSWITKTETVTKEIKDSSNTVIGKCTWVRKTNICGQVDNPDDECQEAVPCEAGTVWHASSCVKACDEGYAFSSSESVNCEKCDTTIRQGISNNTCIRCGSDEFFDKGTSQCISRSSKLQVSDKAHKDCWLCSTAEDLESCLRWVSGGRDITENNKINVACSLGAYKKKSTKASTILPTGITTLFNAKTDVINKSQQSNVLGN